MKLNHLTVAVALSSALFSAGTLAVSDNTITFKGAVSDQTCTVSVNGSDAAPVVLLPTAPAADLAVSGATAKPTTFELGVSNCTAATSAVDITTVFVGNNVTGLGHLGNTGTATNVDIQLLDPSRAAIDLSGGYAGVGDLTLAAGDTDASATYTAQYFATGKATVGTVQAALQYAVTYP